MSHLKALNQVADSHTTGNGVRVDDDVWSDSLTCERHIFLSIPNSACTFLTVSTGKFISNLWGFCGSYADFAELVSIVVPCDHNLINDTIFAAAHEYTCIPFGVASLASFELHKKINKLVRLPLEGIIRIHQLSGTG